MLHSIQPTINTFRHFHSFTLLKVVKTTPSTALLRMQKRVSGMRQWCSQLHPHGNRVQAIAAKRLLPILVDVRHKLVFCQIPGVALNDWRRLFIFLTGKVNVTAHLHISPSDAHTKYDALLTRLSDIPWAQRQDVLDQSLKVLIVREPFERLAYIYLNKFRARYSGYFHKTFGRRIVARYRRNATKDKTDGSDVTFDEFARFVLDTEQEGVNGELLNEHWERYYRRCQPCALQYDVIGKFETLVEDVHEIMNMADLSEGIVSRPYVAETVRVSNRVLKKLYATVSMANLKLLWKMYYPDYNIFSYPYPELLHELLQKDYHDY